MILAAHSNICLARLSNQDINKKLNTNDTINFYTAALSFDEALFKLCEVNNTKIYANDSIKFIANKELGNLYEENE